MLFTKQDIDRIHSSRTAIDGQKYIQDNGYVWVGTYAKSLVLVSIPDPNMAQEETLSSINSKTIKSDTDNIIIVNSVLPAGASTEETQNDILEELRLKGTIENQEINNIDNYVIVSLLTNILEELKTHTKYLNKIYQ